MRIYILFIFLSLFFKVFALTNPGYETKYGLINPTGYRSFIYSNTFDESILSLSNPNPGLKPPTEKELDLYYKPIENLSIELKKRDSRFNNTIEVSRDFDNFQFRQFNIYSEDEIALNRLIHHGLFLKREGIFTSCLGFIKVFSPIYISGYKIISLNRLDLTNISFLNIFEVKKEYISPLNVNQDNSTKLKSTINFHIKNFETFYLNNLTLTDEYFEKENSIKLSVSIPYNNLSLKIGVRERIGSEYLLELGLKSFVFIFKNDILFTVRYINYPLLKFSNSLSIKFLDIYTISCTYQFKYEKIYKYEFIGVINIEKKSWRLNIKYTQPINSSTDFWLIEASISHK